MRILRRIAILTSLAFLLLLTDLAPRPLWLPFEVQLIATDAHAVLGRQRRTRRRGAAVGYQAGKASANQANAEQQQQQQQQQEQQQQQQAAPPPAPAPTPAPAAGALPQGTIVETLPDGCTKKVVDGVEYQFDGVNYYRAAFQGNQLVYVAATP